MGTITITSAGFAAGPNGSRAGTISDADYTRLITWARARTAPVGTDNRTNAQVLSDFVGAEWRAWTDAVQVSEREPASDPNSPIDIS